MTINQFNVVELWLIETVNFSIEFSALILLMNSVMDFSKHSLDERSNKLRAV